MPANFRNRPRDVAIPFDAVGALATDVWEDITREALRVNDRYVHEFLEKYAFCPYSQQGRAQGRVSRYVHHFEQPTLEPLVERMLEVAEDSEQVVAQVIFPLIEVSPEDWRRFCHQLTALAHRRRGGRDVLAIAPLHPELRYTERSDETLIPLFRRTPDPTIQWVRLDALADIYRGRGKGTQLVDADDVARLLEQMMAEQGALDASKCRVPGRHAAGPLWDRIAATNAAMARRLTVSVVENLLAEFAADARRSYAKILLASL